MIRVGDRLLEIELDAFLVGSLDGTMCFCSGARPTNPNSPPEFNRMVAAVPITRGTFIGDGDRAFIASGVTGIVKNEGRVVYMVVITADRGVLFDIDVRTAKLDPAVDTGAYVTINRLDLLPGDHLNIEAMELQFKRPPTL